MPAAKRAALQKQLDALNAEIESLRTTANSSPKAEEIQALIPDVVIYWNAVHTVLADHEFFKPNEIGAAKALLDEGLARARALQKGEAPWTTQHGLVVRGYVSRLDGSVQPYGLVVPKSYTKEGDRKFRLDFWFHGRGETLSEVNFLRDREKNVGTFAPPDAIVLHPYGRYCNANKFAGEIDALEALDSVRSRYRIDDDRIVVRGFSMGVPRPGIWPSTIPIGGRQPIPAPASRKRPRLLRSSTRSRSLPPGGRSSFITCTTAPTGPTICGIVQPWPIPAKSIRKSRRPTSWPKP